MRMGGGQKFGAQRADRGDEVLGRGQLAPSHQLEDLGSAVSSQAGSGTEPHRQVVSFYAF